VTGGTGKKGGGSLGGGGGVDRRMVFPSEWNWSVLRGVRGGGMSRGKSRAPVAPFGGVDFSAGGMVKGLEECGENWG